MRLKFRAYPERRELLAVVPSAAAEPFVVQMTAHLLADRAWVRLREGRRSLAALLRLKDALPRQEGELEALSAAFERILENQLIRRRLQLRNRDIMEYLVPLALVPALQAPAGEPAERPLSDEQRAEIFRLAAEAETEADPLGIRRTWKEGPC